MNDKMIDSECDISKSGEENHFNLQECHNMTKEIEEELKSCKTDQNDIRSQLHTLHDQSKDDNNSMRNFFFHRKGYCKGCNKVCYHKDVQNEAMQDEAMQDEAMQDEAMQDEAMQDEAMQDEEITNLKEQIANLKEQIALLKKENNSARLLLHTSSIDALRIDQIERENVKLSKQQLETEQSYLEVIKACNSELFKVKVEFAEQQSLWMTSKETIETLKQEKYEMKNNLEELKQNAHQKESNNLQAIKLLTEELFAARAQIEKLNDLNLHSEKELCESKKTVNHVTAKNEVTCCKLGEALDLIEHAVKEEILAANEKAAVMERNFKLEEELAHSAEVHTAKMQEEIAKLKDVHEHDVKKYLLEIKELKSKLEKKETLLDQSERNNSLMEEELEKLRKHAEDLVKKSTTKILENLPLKSNSDQTFKHADHECNFCNILKFQHNFELKQLREEITNLKENLAISNDKLQQIQQQIQENPNLYVKLDKERTDLIKRCNHLESQLIKAKDKESLATELVSLQTIFDYEIRKRDDERCTLEKKIRELEMNLQKETYTRENKSGTSTSPVQVSSQHCAVNEATSVLRDETWQSLLIKSLKKQEKSIKEDNRLKVYIVKCEERNKRLTEEALLWSYRAESYYKSYKVANSKLKEQNEIVHTLKKKNDELQKILSLTNQSLMYQVCTKT